MSNRILHVVSLIAIAMSAHACGSNKHARDSGTPDASSERTRDAGVPGKQPTDAGASMKSDSGAAKAMGKVRGRIFTAADLAPVAEAKVTAADGSTVETDSTGAFSLEIGKGESQMLLTNAPGFARAITRVVVNAGAETYVEITLARESAKGMVNAASGGKLSGSDGASATFPASVFMDAKGTMMTGMVEVSITALNPGRPEQMRAFPGTFQAVDKSGGAGLLETFVPMDISARGSDGAPLTMAPGTSADVTFPVYDPDNAPQQIALWSLDPATGTWHEEGTAERAIDADGNPVYKGKIQHMSWWNCDAFLDQLTCIRGCVEKDGKPAVGAGILAKGIDYRVSGGGFSDARGCFAQDVKIGGQLSLQAVAPDAASSVKVITGGNTRMSVSQGADRCQDIGTLTLEPMEHAADGCPPGYTRCDGGCVDLKSDPQHCASCSLSCTSKGSIGNGSCIAGSCVCKASETICSNMCTDVKRDRNNCGACGAACADGKECVAGACQPIVCSSALQLCGNSCVDTMTSSGNCGACGKYCTKGATCQSGQCTCGMGATLCTYACSDSDPTFRCGRCVNTSSDSSNCGACGTACGVGTECRSGSCKPIECTNGTTLCASSCLDLKTDKYNCGTCGHECALDEECRAGVCESIVCIPGTTLCSGYCVDLQTDAEHCGQCSIQCDVKYDATCVAGACQCALPAMTHCSGRCVDLKTDPYYCGTCGTQCNSGQCTMGQCVP